MSTKKMLARFRNTPPHRFLLLAGTTFLFVALLSHPTESSLAVKAGMDSFCSRLVPVLFPYMVLSHVFCTYGLLEPLAPLLPVHRLFHMDVGVFGAFVMGQVCGYPVGGGMTADLRKQGKVSVAQGELLLGLSAGASPAFLLHVVGAQLWGNIAFGAYLYLLQVVFALVAGGVLGRKLPGVESSRIIADDEIPFARCFCEAVGGSAVKLVSVGGYIVFFSLLSSLLPFSGVWQAVASSILEFASGTVWASSLGGNAGLFLTGFAVGCGGVSVLLQTAHMTAGSELSLRVYCLYKLASGVFCGIGAWVWGWFVPMTAMPKETAALVGGRSHMVLFLLCWLVICLVWGRRRAVGINKIS